MPPLERRAGFPPDHSDELSRWLSDFLAQPDQVHNVDKLRRSGTVERHLFVLVPPYTTAPFEVTHILTSSDAPTPQAAPTLPDGVTHVWAMSLWAAGDVFCWSQSAAWRRFPKMVDVSATTPGL